MSALSRRRPARRQRGVILFIALIVLVAMSLAGIALMRSVDTNVLIAGNLAFRQSTTMMGDIGVEAARSWLSANVASLNSNQPGGNNHYWANWQSGLDFVGTTAATSDDYNWAQSATVTSPDPAYVISYVVHRLCAGEGKSTDTTCMTSAVGAGSTGASGGTKGTVTYGTQARPGISSIFYRVTVRVTGPRNTVSFVQALLN